MHVQQRRGRLIETEHEVRAVAVRDGQILWSDGPEISSPWRSAAKPVQLWVSLGLVPSPAVDSVDVALGSSSHAGQPAHADRLRDLQGRLGVAEASLRCGAEPPLHRGSWEALLRSGDAPQAIHNDCSGKHTWMIAATQAQGWPSDYRDPAHPLQRRVAEAGAAWCGETPGLATDGCGVPVLCVSVDGMARAWARLAAAMADVGDPWTATEGPYRVRLTPELPSPAARRILPDLSETARAATLGWAMARNPWWTSGDGRLDLDIAAGARVPLVGKIGAQGIFCLAIPHLRLGLALKVRSGDEEALAVATAAALHHLAPDAWREPEGWRWGQVHNVVGDLVGDRLVAPALGAYVQPPPPSP